MAQAPDNPQQSEQGLGAGDPTGLDAGSPRSTLIRTRRNAIFCALAIAGTVVAIAILFVLLATVTLQGAHRLSWAFITGMSSNPDEAGILASLVGTIIVVAICALAAIPLGVGTAVLIEEFKPKGKEASMKDMTLVNGVVLVFAIVLFFIGYKLGITLSKPGAMAVYALFCLALCYALFHKLTVMVAGASPLVVLHGFVETNIRNLAGVPSIVYGILGVTAFAMMFNLFGTAGQSNLAIGQQWFDQYVDAEGNYLFVEVDSFDTPATPLYDAPVETPLRFEVWRDNRTPLTIGTQTVADFDAKAAQDREIPVTPEALEEAQLLDVEATLALRDGGWVLELTEAAAEAVDLVELGVREGDQLRYNFLFDDYTQLLEFSTFTVTAVAADELMLFGGVVNGFQDAVEPGSSALDRQVMPRESFGPLLSEITEQLDDFEDAIKDGIDDSRTGERRRSGPAAIDQATAESIVDNAIASGPFTGDTSELRATLIGQVLACDGMESRELRGARRALTEAAVNAELDARMRGKAMSGQNPNRVDYRAWYYIALPLGRGVLAGGLTLMLVILPIVIVASQEALRAVPGSYREGALALGATKWQAVSNTALPAAIPGICTGTILAMSRAIGEAAPILILGGVVFINFTPGNLMDSFTVLPLQIFSWAGQPQDAYRELAATAIIVLLVVLLCFNGLAIYIRNRAGKHQ